MNKLKVLLIDDEKNARLALTGMITSNFPDIEIVREAENVPDAVKAIHKLKPDVILLDIEMPGYLGVNILDFFDSKDITFKIIFVTAYNDYAIQAFEMAAIDYLLKPTRIDQLKRAFDRIRTEQNNSNEQYAALKENLSGKKLSKIAFNTSEGLIISNLEQIRMLKADGSYTHICFTDDNKVTVSKSLQEYKELEDSQLFFRINRSYLINISCIEKISKKDGGNVVLDNGLELSISLEKRNKLAELFKDKTF